MPNIEKPLMDVLDDYGIRTGEKLSREEIHTLGKVHRAVHLYLFDRSNNILLQRRSDKVDQGPGMFSISLTGHVDAGEGSFTALARELKEELGLNAAAIKPQFLFSFRQDAELSPTYIDRQFNDVYAAWHDINLQDIAFDPEEVSEVILVPFTEFQKMVSDRQSQLAPFYGRECADVVYFLTSLLKYTDLNT
jgi:isopentenyl-diphosphate Delta-isomerase